MSLRHRVPAATLLAVGLGAALAGCSRGSSSRGSAPSPDRDPNDSARVVKKDAKPTTTQASALSSGLEETLTRDLEPLFAEAYAQAGAGEGADATALGRATALGVSKRIVAKAGGQVPTACRFDLFDLSEWSKCVVREVLTEDLGSAAGLRALVQGVVATENEGVLGKIETLQSALARQGDEVLAKTASIVSKLDTVEKLLSRVTKSLDGVKDALEILARREALADAPFIGESFFAGRAFTLTTGYAQGSVGRERMYNLASHRVRLEINNGRLVLLRDGAELFDSGNTVDLVLGAYPVLASVKVGKETYHQIDFSSPQNKQFVLPFLAAPGVPQLSLSADVVVPRVAHARKAPIRALGSGLHFDAKDASLVLDSLVLVNGTDAVLSTDSETDPLSLDKDTVRPTVRLVQGLFAIDETNEAFEKSQRQDVKDARASLAQLGVDDKSQGNDPAANAFNVPYFTSGVLLPEAGGRTREPWESVRKFNREKEIVWVVSSATPAKAVPVVKSAVLSFNQVFATLGRKGVPATTVKVLTQAEFEAANRDAGLRIGDGPLHAADPRVNMILWDESKSLGAAWATASAHPRSGEVISADVMLSGTMWAKQGCQAFFQKTWTIASQKPARNRKTGPVPTPALRSIWDIQCEALLFKEGFYAPFGDSDAAGGVPFPFPFPEGKVTALSVRLEKATLALDAAEIARVGSELLGREVSEAEVAGRPVAKAALPVLENGEIDEAALPAPLRAARAKLRTAIGGMSNASALKSVAEAKAAASALAKGAFAKGFAEPKIALSGGRNSVRAAVDCLRTVGGSDELALADVGSPALESPDVKTPVDAAYALLRATLVHELGHAFGLRHNFMGSLVTAKPAEGTEQPLATIARTDSIMDYNDYGVDFDLGAMQDYASPEGASKTATFGAYDVLALSNIYGLDASALKFEGKPSFCTDGNVSFLSSCQQYDWGNDPLESALQALNLRFARLSNAQAIDLIISDVQDVLVSPLQRTLGELRKVTAQWAIAQHAADGTRSLEEKQALVAASELSFRGVGAKQEWLQAYEPTMGRKLRGVRDFLTLEKGDFDEPAFADLLVDVLRQQTAMEILASADALRAKDRDDGLDDGFFNAVRDVKVGATVYGYRSELLDIAASRILIPAGKPISYGWFNDGVRSDAPLTLDGKPLALTLEVPFFNHVGQVAVLREVQADDPAMSGEKVTRVVTLKGTEKLPQMVIDAALAAALAPGYESSPSSVRLAADAKALRTVLENGSTCRPGTTACYDISENARAGAGFVLGLYGDAVQLARGPLP